MVKPTKNNIEAKVFINECLKKVYRRVYTIKLARILMIVSYNLSLLIFNIEKLNLIASKIFVVTYNN